jgi:hypothetical protein
MTGIVVFMVVILEARINGRKMECVEDKNG